ncbi:hypothetical protein AB0F81_08605 [Actinoplanes sp. NPDC024001]|uniref:hypothetical protein n=1 Tax=Actinoplanes sp. NPDC024001 TaxID=3154598 RepID=UPI003407F564
MSYAAVQPPAAAPPAGSRPAVVTTAVALLWAMAVAGLAYAIGMVAIAPGTVDRFRDATGDTDQIESYVAVIWIDAAVAVAVALLILALFVILGIGLRRGSRIARGVTLGVCVLGVLAGFGSLLVIAGQRAGEALPGSVGAALGAAYPDGWIGLNVAVAAAQVLAYLVLAALVLFAPRQFFGGGVPRNQIQPPPYPGYWPPAGTPGHAPGYGYQAPAAYPPYGPSGPWGASPQWAAPQSSEQRGDIPSEPDQTSSSPPVEKPPAASEGEYWSRPRD